MTEQINAQWITENAKPVKEKSYETWCCKPPIGMYIRPGVVTSLKTQEQFVICGADGIFQVITFEQLSKCYTMADGEPLDPKKLWFTDEPIDWFKIKYKGSGLNYKAVYFADNTLLNKNLKLNGYDGRRTFLLCVDDGNGKSKLELCSPAAFANRFNTRGWSDCLFAEDKVALRKPEPLHTRQSIVNALNYVLREAAKHFNCEYSPLQFPNGNLTPLARLDVELRMASNGVVNLPVLMEEEWRIMQRVLAELTKRKLIRGIHDVAFVSKVDKKASEGYTVGSKIYTRVALWIEYTIKGKPADLKIIHMITGDTNPNIKMTDAWMLKYGSTVMGWDESMHKVTDTTCKITEALFAAYESTNENYIATLRDTTVLTLTDRIVERFNQAFPGGYTPAKSTASKIRQSVKGRKSNK